jgi:pilus assembly protein CpaF
MESDVITLQDLYTFHVDAVAATNHIVGSLKPSGLRPSFTEKFERRGIELPRELANAQPGLVGAGNGRA